ncbi:MAG: acyl carrier protein [Pseudoflavonifractor capillosus]|jgi:acyl carrier protein|uniref:acyl carrier protein n=1 Tax=Pseudoflavonifractor TaxID=1017280 RepID=UPI000820D309|nr:acyl carrier protein [Pseudoflavonifractor capillosus]MCI5928962.1 acyl carrier protein [Pseudoflavonifractor capillosus]MDY4660408.1 acyl carrier protein [Pseudoflavonifractor capillosus]SCJ48472.1 Acyl carrier protein [uncultured Flavonifractor sp.]
MTFEEMRDIIVETLSCDAEDVTMEAKLSEDLGADSLAAVELSMALEEASGVTIEDDDLPNMKTVGDLMSYIESHKA